MIIKDKVILVTGGASGLGLACVEYLESLGARLAVFDLNATTHAQVVKKTSESSTKFYDVDVTSESDISAAIDSVIATFGEIRACINCAGIVAGGKTVGRHGALELAKFAKVIDINLIGTFNVLRLVAEKMSQLTPLDNDGSRGVIINTASIAAYEGQVGQAAYAASKGAITSMTLPIARDLGPVGIRVNTIAPGVMSTPMLEAMDDEIKKPLEQAVQFPKRLGKPSEFAQLAAHIIENDYLNGEVIRLDGGIRMSPR